MAASIETVDVTHEVEAEYEQDGEDNDAAIRPEPTTA